MFDSKRYKYASKQAHWLPPDFHPIHGSNKKSMGSGKSVVAEFARLGYRMQIVQKHGFDTGIKTTRGIWPMLRVHYLCSDWWDWIRQYKYKKSLIYSTQKAPAYATDPEPTPAKHPADMLRYMAWAYRFQLKIDGVRVGYPGAYPRPRPTPQEEDDLDV
jgi:hypothetical protein